MEKRFIVQLKVSAIESFTEAFNALFWSFQNSNVCLNSAVDSSKVTTVFINT